MARFAYFADLADGTTLEWRDTVVRDSRGRSTIQAAKTIDYQGRNNITGFAEGHGRVRVNRVVEMKANPSKHECNAACMNASGRVMRCECSCGGRNHGRGGFVCQEAA